jgi:hypothetical protein
LPACHEQPLGLRPLDRLNPQLLAVDREAEVAGLQHRPHMLDRVVDRQAETDSPILGRGLGLPDEDVVEGADGVDHVLGGLGHGSPSPRLPTVNGGAGVGPLSRSARTKRPARISRRRRA